MDDVSQVSEARMEVPRRQPLRRRGAVVRGVGQLDTLLDHCLQGEVAVVPQFLQHMEGNVIRCPWHKLPIDIRSGRTPCESFAVEACEYALRQERAGPRAPLEGVVNASSLRAKAAGESATSEEDGQRDGACDDEVPAP